MKKKLLKIAKSLVKNLPIMLSIILLLGIVKEFITFDKVATLFTSNTIIDTGIGSVVGSVFAGNSMNSYIIARELQTAGISLYAITAFLISWVTVGLFQAPIEAKIFGISFAVRRNALSAVLAMAVSLITVTLWGLI
ncbi:MAG: hypothetical protein KAG94_06185 [Clostridiales bacterium]|nr:hypothetical protein [Clostridiales bacterium]